MNKKFYYILKLYCVKALGEREKGNCKKFMWPDECKGCTVLEDFRKLQSPRTHFCNEFPDGFIFDAMRMLEVTFFTVIIYFPLFADHECLPYKSAGLLAA